MSSTAEQTAPIDAAGGAVEFLLRRMQRSRDFPALSETIRTVNRLTAASNKTPEQLAAAIVNDFALTNKILKVVNSAYYAGFAGKVGTISRAIVVLGIEPIRSLAASLMLFEHLSGGGKADRVKVLIGKSMFSALVAREMAADAGLAQGEEAFLAAMFHRLGELLVAYYLPEEDAAIEGEVAAAVSTRVQAEHSVLGVSCEQLGIAVARHWNLPQLITRSMKAPAKGELKKPGSVEERLAQLAGLASQLTEHLAQGTGPGDRAVDGLLERYRECLVVDQARLAEALQQIRTEYRALAEGLASEGAPAAVRALAGDKPAPTAPLDRDFDDLALPQEDPDGAPQESSADPEPILVEGLQEVTTMLAEGGDLQQLAQVLLETLYRAFGLGRVALCLRDVARRQYAGRIGFGQDIERYLPALRFGEEYERDVFHVALQQKTDVHIADLAGGHGIPAWYQAISPRGSMLFMPLVVQDRAIGCIIAEHPRADGLALGPGPLRLVRALRNQLVLGLRMRRGARG
jgi:HD-like signal output (HDOD) protein